MTSQFDFSNDEWDEIAAAPVLVGMAVAKAEHSGLLGNVRESRVLADAMTSEAAAHPADSLIAQAATTDTSAEQERFKAASGDSLAARAVESCATVAALLADRAGPDEASVYCRWVLDTGRAVANAAKEQGVRVSPAEEALLGRISAALGLDQG